VLDPGSIEPSVVANVQLPLSSSNDGSATASTGHVGAVVMQGKSPVDVEVTAETDLKVRSRRALARPSNEGAMRKYINECKDRSKERS
jgi:hypothetical protein